MTEDTPKYRAREPSEPEQIDYFELAAKLARSRGLIEDVLLEIEDVEDKINIKGMEQLWKS